MGPLTRLQWRKMHWDKFEQTSKTFKFKIQITIQTPEYSCSFKVVCKSNFKRKNFKRKDGILSMSPSYISDYTRYEISPCVHNFKFSVKTILCKKKLVHHHCKDTSWIWTTPKGFLVYFFEFPWDINTSDVLRWLFWYLSLNLAFVLEIILSMNGVLTPYLFLLLITQCLLKQSLQEIWNWRNLSGELLFLHTES